jgi:hypothetical protein
MIRVNCQPENLKFILRPFALLRNVQNAHECDATVDPMKNFSRAHNKNAACKLQASGQNEK